eukprot:gene9230-19145_t
MAALHTSERVFGPTLGKGSFSKVKLAWNKDPNDSELYVVKTFQKSDVKRKQFDQIVAERELLTSLDHPFIVRYLKSWQDMFRIFLSYEYVSGGEFLAYLNTNGPLNKQDAQFYAAQVTLIFKYLHKHDYIYRDLRPENLLFDRKGYLKLINFGLTKRVVFKTYTMCGVPEYLAPEILAYSGYGKSVDWWTLGIFLYEISTGITPFHHKDITQIYNNIMRGHISYPTTMNNDLKKLIEKLLIYDINERYGCRSAMNSNSEGDIHDIMKHVFFTGTDFEEIEKCNDTVPYAPKIDISPKLASNFVNTEEDTQTQTQPATATTTVNSNSNVKTTTPVYMLSAADKEMFLTF